MKIATKKDFYNFMNILIKDPSFEIEGVKAKGNGFVFGRLNSAEELRLDYDVTIMPPKKYFLPIYERILEFNLARPQDVVNVIDQKKRIIVGVHPYDIVAIWQMDKYYMDNYVDDYYLSRRKNTLLVGTNVARPSPKAFFGDMGTGSVEDGFDIMLTDLDCEVAIEAGSGKGSDLIKKLIVREARDEEKKKVQEVKETASMKAGRGLKVAPSRWRELLDRNYDSPVWKSQSEKCLSCGSCTMVCPTCFCFDVMDKSLPNMRGERIRTWDGCLLRDFTRVGSGEIFRERTQDRYRHRFNRKGKYLPDMLDFIGCVGCGRCSSHCIPDIADPVNVINMIYEEYPRSVEEKKLAPLMKMDFTGVKEESLYVPRPATLMRMERLTRLETLFEIELDDGKPLGHQPGQFVEVSIMGYGESPFGVSSAPRGKNFELVVRKVGDVTTRLQSMKPGDKIGIRGPFGKGFPVDTLKGRDLVFIGGGTGIIPMRSFIDYIIDHRGDFGEVTILYGCKEPCELLFKGEVDEWDKRNDLRVLKAVNACPEGECWDGEIGLITCLIPKAQFDPATAVAIVVGPPVMYKFVIRDLKNLGVPDENIIVSLERRMKCGIGKCGHCQINGVYVCKDGPVFSYRDIKDLPEAF